jgi:hypothetical protein
VKISLGIFRRVCVLILYSVYVLVSRISLGPAGRVGVYLQLSSETALRSHDFHALDLFVSFQAGQGNPSSARVEFAEPYI